MDPSSVFFVVNPHSRGQKTRKLWEKSYLPKLQATKELTYDFKIADGIGTGKIAASDAIHDGYNKIVPIGGEGTVNEVVNAIHESKKDIELGFIRSGTVNDYLHIMNWPETLDEQLQLILNGKSVATPLTLVQGDTDRVALNMADVGVAAHVATMASVERRLIWIRSQLRYTLLALMAIKKWKNIPAKVIADDREINGDLSLLMTGFSNEIGGYKALPHADRLGDKMAYVVANNFSKFQMIKLMGVLEKGKHSEEIKGISMGYADTIQIEAEHDLLFEVDGEPFSYNSSNVTVKSLPKAIKVIQPNNDQK